ncbi:MAG: D-aminoacyl-tRNA deacylase [Methylomicrobium sp.]
MITVIQRVAHAQVTVENREIGKIARGILALVGVEKNDSEKEADRLLERILNYRIFADTSGRMNLSLRDIGGGLLLVPQFTLAADTDSGNRPSFSVAASPEAGRVMFDYLKHKALSIYQPVQFGEFGADMQISLLNDGPVTFRLTVAPR